MYGYSCMSLGDGFLSLCMSVCICVCMRERERQRERVSQRKGCLVNVVCNSILDALGYNNCQAWQHLTGLWARIEGQMRCGALRLCVFVCMCVYMFVCVLLLATAES